MSQQGVLAATAADFTYWAFGEYKRSGRPREDFVWVCYPSDLEKLEEGSELIHLHDWDRLKSSEGTERVVAAANARRLTWRLSLPEHLEHRLPGDRR
jgi:hypothetical protein